MESDGAIRTIPMKSGKVGGKFFLDTHTECGSLGG